MYPERRAIEIRSANSLYLLRWVLVGGEGEKREGDTNCFDNQLQNSKVSSPISQVLLRVLNLSMWRFS